MTRPACISYQRESWSFEHGQMPKQECRPCTAHICLAEGPRLVSNTSGIHCYGSSGAECSLKRLQGYQKAKMTDQGMDTLKWGSDYLLRTLAKQKTSAGDKFPVYLIAYQLGNYTLDNSLWERPETIKGPRPMYYVTTRNGGLATLAKCMLNVQSCPQEVPWRRACHSCARRCS